MPFSQHLVEELNMLTRFNLESMNEGLKVHSNAAPEAIEAVKRLYKKEMVDQPDGGYLTHRGIDAAQHAQLLLDLLKNQS